MAKKFKKIRIEPDFIYQDEVVQKFINCLMRNGKKELARKIVYGSFDIIEKETKQDPLKVFHAAIKEVTPEVEVRPQRVGGATYQVPKEVSPRRGLSLAIRWLIQAAKSKKGKPMEKKLVEEIILASKGEGEAVRKKINVHKMAQANKAFAYLAK
ncbi:MAG: 30S ribosomal protein S7 [Minisyncoccia bacterium]